MELMNFSSPPSAPGGNQVHSIQSLSEAWARKYVQKLADQDKALEVLSGSHATAAAAQQLMHVLRSTSAQAWTKTEALLAQEIVRHQIDLSLIDPWEIAKDAHRIYEKALAAFAGQMLPARFAVMIAPELGKIRQKHSAIDPRVIGFISMQFHYTGQMLLGLLPSPQRLVLSDYFKVIDDHLYMPLQRAFRAAAEQDFNSPALQVVQQLLPLSSIIARAIVTRVTQMYPGYRCHTGLLKEPVVQISSLRDVEMFQVYLWVCVLENNISAIQQELFPLCVMLYPRLKVRWELVRQLIHFLGVEVRAIVEPEQAKFYIPYYQSLWAMFSPQVFPDSDF